MSRSHIQKLIKDGSVKVRGEVVNKPSYSLSPDEEAVLSETTLSQEIPHIDLPVIYEDDNCVVIDKPLGVLVHSKGAYNPEGTVATWLATRPNFEFEELNERSGIVHRLDRATSGVMICAKNRDALGFLQKQFQTRKAKKQYVAMVEGKLKHEAAHLDLPIERNPKQPQTFRVGANGKSAFTEYRVLKSNDTESLVELKPTTGRTHQLRVHLEHIGHPIIGDVLYGGKKADRLFLHAQSLEITLPEGGVRKTFTSEVPKEFLERFNEN